MFYGFQQKQRFAFLIQKKVLYYVHQMSYFKRPEVVSLSTSFCVDVGANGEKSVMNRKVKSDVQWYTYFSMFTDIHWWWFVELHNILSKVEPPVSLLSSPVAIVWVKASVCRKKSFSVNNWLWQEPIHLIMRCFHYMETWRDCFCGILVRSCMMITYLQ